MPVPTFIHAPRDGLPDLFEDSDPGSTKRMFDVIDQLGWVIDENPGGHLICHNIPLKDSPIYLRVDTDEAILDLVKDKFNFNNTTAAIVRVFNSLSDAQAETNALTELTPVRISGRDGAGSASRKVNYGWIGDSRFAYLIVSGISRSSGVHSGFQLGKFTIYAFGEISSAAGDPGLSVYGGGNGETVTNFEPTSFVDVVNGGSLRFGGGNNALSSGLGFTTIETFSSGLVNRLGTAEGQNEAVAPFLSPIYLYETGGRVRGSMPGLVVPALSMGAIQEGISEGIAFETLAASATGLRIPAANTTGTEDFGAHPVFIDIATDWDNYHAA